MFTFHNFLRHCFCLTFRLATDCASSSAVTELGCLKRSVKEHLICDWQPSEAALNTLVRFCRGISIGTRIWCHSCVAPGHADQQTPGTAAAAAVHGSSWSVQAWLGEVGLAS